MEASTKIDEAVQVFHRAVQEKKKKKKKKKKDNLLTNRLPSVWCRALNVVGREENTINDK